MTQMSFNFTKKDITEGTALHSFVSSLMEPYPKYETIIKHGQLKSVLTIYAGLLVMIFYPEVAEKARNKIKKFNLDRFLGPKPDPMEFTFGLVNNVDPYTNFNNLYMQSNL
ncbi:hypothetical protein K435DRAFT_806081 [Dendrothele bispora CBS 962.96]|uniref:Cytochrome P450 n=1 Tax=Dendrothele bispora (strain CBS 962.96) TaxID=1314807 RepID=A0A4V4HCZ5_DENBC|nr:hypothetical protein K435DRAFT_806081 [Dendrothele bispora CBS 962.96]